MGAPMLIWRARAPMIRAFSKRVYRKGLPRPGGGLEVTLVLGTGRPQRLGNDSIYFNLPYVEPVGGHPGHLPVVIRRRSPRFPATQNLS